VRELVAFGHVVRALDGDLVHGRVQADRRLSLEGTLLVRELHVRGAVDGGGRGDQPEQE
jgi:hypothetical protein